jgi:hypothetical protein
MIVPLVESQIETALLKEPTVGFKNIRFSIIPLQQN